MSVMTVSSQCESHMCAFPRIYSPAWGEKEGVKKWKQEKGRDSAVNNTRWEKYSLFGHIGGKETIYFTVN